MRLARAAEIATRLDVIFEAAALALPNPLVHANYGVIGDAAHRRSLLSRNAPRSVRAPAVTLVRYPPGSVLEGDRSYLLIAGGTMVREQVAGWFTDLEADYSRLTAPTLPVHSVEAPCLLLARYGENTWGHWVGELLVKAAIAERFYPGRFAYVVPGWTTEVTPGRTYSTAVLETLAAFGIGRERLIRLASFSAYRFAALHDIADAWGDGIHPEALACLRAVDVPASEGRRLPRIAVLRRGRDARAVFNAGEVESCLRHEGFSEVQPVLLPFLDQLRLFRDADVVVGSLGSDLASLLFARDGARVVSLAPSLWNDGYFIRMFQRLGVLHADIRGPSTWLDGGGSAQSSHVADPRCILEGLEAVLSPASPEVVIDGERMPRRLGEAVLALDFGRDGNASMFTQGDGWSRPEAAHTWSVGGASLLVFERSLLPSSYFWIEIEGMGHVYPPYMPTRPLAVAVCGTPAGSFAVIGEVRLFCLVRRDMLPQDGPVTIAFQHPLCPSPKMLGRGEDARCLGFGFRRVAFYRQEKSAMQAV